jgi:anaerobic selenocysteine-containing dehydrogenase
LSPTTSSASAIVPTFCHGCGSYRGPCGLLCHAQDGRFVRVEGNPAAFNNGIPGSTSLCPKAFSAPQYVYAADRLQYPLRRAGAKGEGRFQRITWDEALDTIAAKLVETKQKYGAEAFGILSPEYWPVPERLRQPQLHAQRHLRDPAHGLRQNLGRILQHGP